uniref:Ovule protein n=1 Tax=Caenorhabditis tropicalis TaxID=1561998 RepID=A0A1I7U0M7_9PELO
MDERRGSTRQDRRRSTYGHSADSPAHHSHHNFLMPPQPVSWIGTQIIQEFQPTTTQPNENPIGWAIFNPLPIRGPLPRPRLCQVQITTASK